ncbi:hypothetical protein ACFVZN_04230 [Streptomyces virginiae]|uniref:hypothetical protein n=1 Tax=Streptomyces virginiae TaxID=1961 RepID=UPI0036A4D1B6
MSVKEAKSPVAVSARSWLGRAAAAVLSVELVQGRAQAGGDVGQGVLVSGAPAQVRLRALEQARG